MRNKRLILWLLLGALITLSSAPQVEAIELLEAEAIVPFNSEATLEELLEELPEAAQLDDPELLLVNRNNRIEYDLPMEFAYTASGHLFNAYIAQEFYDLITAAEAAGHVFQTVSAHRTMAYQAGNFDARYYMYINDGYSEADAFYYTDMFVAPPDATEHATGLAFDLLGYDYNEYGRDLHQVYGQYPSAIWLDEVAPEYGFIVRYPQGKQEITGYEYEPWHIRYVGRDNALFMDKHGLTLEEFLTLIQLRDSEKEAKDN